MSASSDFKDLFSRQSGDYARFRPTYPNELFEYLASLVDHHDLVWDVGTGNGQAAIKVATAFAQVVGTDPSAKQISSAVKHSKVGRRRLSAFAISTQRNHPASF